MGDVGAIVLAAGGSSRLGQPKQLLTFDGETLVHSVSRAARDARCKLLCVVTGDDHECVAQAVSDLHPTIVRNESWARGIGSSIRLGVQQLVGSDISAMVLLACDQPALNAGVISALIARHEDSGCAIVASRYAGTLGIPALFDRSCFKDLQRLPDESGAKPLFTANGARMTCIEFPDGALDLDTPADLQAALAPG